MELDLLWEQWRPVVNSLGILIITLVVGLIIYHILYRVFTRVAEKSESIYLKPMAEYWRRPLRVIFLLFLIYLVYPLLSFPAGFLDVLRHAIVLALIGTIGWFAIRTVNVLRDVILSRHRIDISEDNLENRMVYTQVKILEKILIVIISVITVSTALMTFPRIQQVGVSILASAGIAGLIIGLAAQKSLGNILAGIQIAFTQPIRIDDVLIIEGEYGQVEEITLTYVVLRIWDKRRLIIPINFFNENIFQNWTRVSADLLGTVYLYVDYEVPVDAIRKELTCILEGTELWDKEVGGVQVTNTTDNYLEIRALMSAKDSSTLWDLRCLVREKLLEFVRANYPESLPKTRVELQSHERRQV
jgi:small-conductance mechanosensitive channel